jgi:PhnB protein
MKLSNYLFFTTTCEPALAFYAAAGLGHVVAQIRYGERGAPVQHEAMRGRIMYARFEGPGVLFHASDNHDAEPMRGSAQFLESADLAATERLFSALAAGGAVTTPFAMQPWGTHYGKLTDRFGVQWMFSCTGA